MIPTSLPAGRLPKARALTDVLLAPAGPGPDPDALARLRSGLLDAATPVPSTAAAPIRVDAFFLRTAGHRDDAGEDEAPFRWSPRTARRSIGVAAVALCVGRTVRNPADAAAATVARLVDEARQGCARRGSLGEWLGRAPGAVRAAALSEAVTWASHLHGALEWSRLRAAVVGGPDRWWDRPGTPAVACRGRVDVRVPTALANAGAGDGVDRPALTGPAALLTVVGGRPGPTSRVELGLAALVDLLSRPDTRPPARVIGWWPDCGRALVLAVDLGLLVETAEAVVDAVAAESGRQPRPTRAA